MMEIDGSAGGQALRTAIGLSAVRLEPVKVVNIRASREKPGMMAQHLAGVKAAAEFCGADMKGAELGSTEIEFTPKSHSFSDKTIDIGTAGSISLLLQTIAPLLVFSDKPLDIKIHGGTAGIGAPTMEYTKFVTFPTIRSLGVMPARIMITKQGFYPKGGGMVRVESIPSKLLRSRKIIGKEGALKILGASIAGSLPNHVAARQADAAKKILIAEGFTDVDISPTVARTDSPGTSITLWAQRGDSVIGSCSIGELGKPAEKVGEGAAASIVASLKSGKVLDRHMADQIIPFMGLARGTSEVTVEEVTEHVLTNIAVTEKMLGVEFVIDKNEGRISVDGIGHERRNDI